MAFKISPSYSPDSHNRTTRNHLQAHGDQHLNLSNIISGIELETWNREFLNLCLRVIQRLG